MKIENLILHNEILLVRNGDSQFYGSDNIIQSIYLSKSITHIPPKWLRIPPSRSTCIHVCRRIQLRMVILQVDRFCCTLSMTYPIIQYLQPCPLCNFADKSVTMQFHDHFLRGQDKLSLP